MQKIYCDLRKLFLFLLVGLPSFFVAVPLNYHLVIKLQLNTPIAYAIVMTMQVIINFFLCKKFVFKDINNRSLGSQFIMFFSGIAVFRAVDWILYSILVEYFNLYFLYVQFFNILLFSVLKFSYSKRVFEK